MSFLAREGKPARTFASEAKSYVERNSRCPRAPLSGLHFWVTVGVVDGYWESYCFKCGGYSRGNLFKGYGQ